MPYTEKTEKGTNVATRRRSDGVVEVTGRGLLNYLKNAWKTIRNKLGRERTPEDLKKGRGQSFSFSFSFFFFRFFFFVFFLFFLGTPVKKWGNIFLCKPRSFEFCTFFGVRFLIKKITKTSLAVRSKMSSKLMYANCVRYFDRECASDAVCGVCIFYSFQYG